jgi:hypothetical protein
LSWQQKFHDAFGDFTQSGKGNTLLGRMFSDTCSEDLCGPIIAEYKVTMEPSPMWIREEDRSVQWNWVAILAYAGSLLVSLAAWAGVIRAVQHLVR